MRNTGNGNNGPLNGRGIALGPQDVGVGSVTDGRDPPLSVPGQAGLSAGASCAPCSTGALVDLPSALAALRDAGINVGNLDADPRAAAARDANRQQRTLVRPGSRWTDWEIMAAAEAADVDEAISREVMKFQLYQRVPQAVPFGCTNVSKTSPEKATFGVDFDPLRYLLACSNADPIDQELLAKGVQTGTNTFARAVMAPHAEGTYVFPGVRVAVMTSGISGQINEANCAFTFYPKPYNAYNAALQFNTTTETEPARPNTDNVTRISQRLDADGGWWQFFALRGFSKTIPAASVEPQSLDTTTNVDAMISRPADPGDGFTSTLPVRDLVTDLVGLPESAGITIAVTPIKLGQTGMGNMIAQLLTRYYGRVIAA